MNTENLIDEAETFNQACCMPFYLLLRYRNSDGKLIHLNLTEVEEALDGALSWQPNFVRPEKKE